MTLIANKKLGNHLGEVGRRLDEHGYLLKKSDPTVIAGFNLNAMLQPVPCTVLLAENSRGGRRS